jgi:acyl-CoA synthetase (AMP-forming)/AMP-acid ligase II
VSAAPPDPASLDRPWVASYPPGVPPTYRLPDVPVTRFLDDAARDFPANVAIDVPGAGSVDNATLRSRVDGLASALAAQGLSAGDRVLVAVPSGHAAPVVLLAVWRVGATLVPVDPRVGSDHLVDIAEDAEVAAAIATRPVLETLRSRESGSAPEGLEHLTLPPKVQAVIQARLARLSTDGGHLHHRVRVHRPLPRPGPRGEPPACAT